MGNFRTHARGHVVLTSQEMAEKQRRQRQAQETQRIIEQQVLKQICKHLNSF